jgi:hypothetical protein
VVHARSLGDTTLTFIVSGKLWRNSLIMQDEQTGTLWSHVTGLALDGPLVDRQLAMLPSVQTSWSEWVAEHPDTKVLQKESEVRSSRYEAYFQDPERTGLFRADWLRERMPGKAKVHGITRGPHALAIADERLPAGELVNFDLAGDYMVAFRAREGGVHAYISWTQERYLRFVREPDTDRIHDRQTRSVWDLTLGICTEGELAGALLEPLLVRTAFWFAWSSFFPNTLVLD